MAMQKAVEVSLSTALSRMSSWLGEAQGVLELAQEGTGSEAISKI